MFRQQFSDVLYDIITNPDYAPEYKVKNLKFLIEEMPQLVSLNNQLIAKIQKFNENSPGVTVEVPSNITINFRYNFAFLDGATPLILAALQHSPGMVQILIAAKASLDVQEIVEQRSALMIAAKQGDQTMVNLLVEAKANPALEDDNEHTALTMAASGNYVNVMQTLIEKAAITAEEINRSLRIAIRKKKLSAVIALLRHGAVIQDPDKFLDLLKSCDHKNHFIFDLIFEALVYFLQQYDLSKINGIQEYLKTLETEYQIQLTQIDQNLQLYLAAALSNLVIEYVTPSLSSLRCTFFSKELEIKPLAASQATPFKKCTIL